MKISEKVRRILSYFIFNRNKRKVFLQRLGK